MTKNGLQEPEIRRRIFLEKKILIALLQTFKSKAMDQQTKVKDT